MAEIKLPQLGESVTEGTIGRWLKSVGDRVKKYDALCEVVTDKVNAEIPSDFEGVLQEILITEGTTVPVGTLICRIETANEKDRLDQMQTSPSDSTSLQKVSEENVGLKLGPRYSPAVLQLLQEKGVDPTRLVGSGLNGRITRKDVLTFVENEMQLPQKQVIAAPKLESVIHAENPIQSVSNDTIHPLTPIRKTIAKRMLESKQTAPHAWMMIEVDVTALVKFRESIKEDFKRKEGISLTYLPFFIKTVAEALKEFPIVNSSWNEDHIILKKDIHISVAVAAGDALFVPVIHHADRLSVSGLSHAINDLATKARTGKLSSEEVQGGTFTVNNTGAFGSIQSMPIINSPQAAILSVESIVKRPVAISEDSIGIRSMVNLCLSLDHRILDGLVCGQFLASIKNRMESNRSFETLM